MVSITKIDDMLKGVTGDVLGIYGLLIYFFFFILTWFYFYFFHSHSHTTTNKKKKRKKKKKKKKTIINTIYIPKTTNDNNSHIQSQRKYQNPLTLRYSSSEMSYIFSNEYIFSTWRKLWIALAKGEKKYGLKEITEKQIHEMEKHIEMTDEEYVMAKKYEKEKRHDVVAHIHTYGDVCPLAKPIIHIGATSCFVKDNAEQVQMIEGMRLIRKRLLNVMYILKEFCMDNKDVVTLGYTHFQPAQLITVGKRGCLWLQDFVYDFHELEGKMNVLLRSFRGVKGTTGTQASFLKVFNGDEKKVKALDEFVTREMGFKKPIGVSSQTYTRKLDYSMLSVLSAIAQTSHKIAVDIRLLMHEGEIEEPFQKKQVGSSAMAYKRNPMRCERLCGISRYVISLTSNTAHTFSNQWFERTLDDSSNRRLVISQSFLAVDGILKLVANVLDGIVVYPLVIRKNVLEQLPFMATENILMSACKNGANRQEVHERIRELSMETVKRIKLEGKSNDLIEKMKKDELFKKYNIKFDEILDPEKFIGRSKSQVVEYIESEVNPILSQYKVEKGEKETLKL